MEEEESSEDVGKNPKFEVNALPEFPKEEPIDLSDIQFPTFLVEEDVPTKGRGGSSKTKGMPYVKGKVQGNLKRFEVEGQVQV